MIDCPRNARRERELASALRRKKRERERENEERDGEDRCRITAVSEKKNEEDRREREIERRKRRRTMTRVLEVGKRLKSGTGRGGRRHKFRASVKRALRGEALPPSICQYPEEIRDGTWPEG